MVLVYRSTISEVFKIIGEDSDGSRRVATATRVPGSQERWDLRLTHPSGRNWNASFNGPNVLDALGALVNDKNVEYVQERSRGHKPEPPRRDMNRQIPDVGDHAPITMSGRDSRSRYRS
jgi:hypothetical protein